MAIANKILTNSTTGLVKLFVLGNVKNFGILKMSGPKIIIANHNSYLDHFVLLQLLKKANSKQPVYFLTKQEAFDGTFSKWWHENLNCVPVDRNGKATTAMLTLKDKLLSEKAIVVIYPEGTRSPTGEMYHGKTGAETLAYLTGVPIIPIGMHGLFDVLPRKTNWPNLKNRVDVAIGNPIYLHKSDKKSLKKINDTNMETLALLANERLDKKRVGEFDVRQEMFSMLVQLNQDALRNYPDSQHSPEQYYKRSLYIGKQLYNANELTNEEQMIILIERARSLGRLAVDKGLRTFQGRINIKKTAKVLKAAYQIDSENAELLYVIGNYYHLTGSQVKFVKLLEKVNSLAPNKIQYMVSLAKAYKETSQFSELFDILKQIKLIVPVNQLEQRRKLEAMVMLMRLNPNIKMEVTDGSEAIY
ncbi:lysophospholipid acyltransferase family protein [Weissella bombi]|uniref:1-acyl-sn-glycerol-3-phosphate acyltransferases n=1 Tax=Weissella bombi TaxID=1505725 RepID=A0A1C3YTC9_9LACO|nr:lysophospholipid acyltransferase family protein [Weissella bombi]SCB73278.1 1-acyl-sn-glycerol-3-phosphate acyltransferases [Weissella bombi]